MDDFLNNVKGFVGKVPFIKDVVAMYYCMVDPKTPIQVKLTIGGALAYFLAPVDAIIDLLPVIGFTDDASVIALTLAAVSSSITVEHRQQADAFFNPDTVA
jgi:uncharacterized membrane protein YkvA (DUF1232 family)